MNRKLQAAALAAAVALVAGRAVPAQEPERPMEPGAQAMQGDHLTEAVKQTQAAIDAGNSGQKDLVVEHAREALTHAEAAEKEHPSPNPRAPLRVAAISTSRGASPDACIASSSRNTDAPCSVSGFPASVPSATVMPASNTRFRFVAAWSRRRLRRRPGSSDRAIRRAACERDSGGRRARATVSVANALARVVRSTQASARRSGTNCRAATWP